MIVQFEPANETEQEYIVEFEQMGLLEIMGVFENKKLLLHLKHKELNLERGQIENIVEKDLIKRLRGEKCTYQ